MQKWFFLVFLIWTSLVSAQTQYAISGKVTDSQNQIIMIGDVLLFAKEKDSLVKYTVLVDGSFNMASISKGSYRLKLSSLGFEDFEQFLELDTDISLNLTLRESTVALDEVEVVAKKPMFTNEKGNLRMNVENPIFSSIPESLELLAKFPGIQLGPNRESFTFLGKGAPLIYIGNRRISLDEFKAISVNDISSVEIIKNPSSKYEAEGRAVLLVTRKTADTEGIKIDLAETASFRHNFNNYAKLNGNFKKRKLTLKGNFDYDDLLQWESHTFKFGIPAQDILTDYLVLVDANDRIQINGGGGLFYEFNDTEYVSFNTSANRQTNDSPILTDTFLKRGIEQDHISSKSDNLNTKDYFTGNFNYNKKVQKDFNLFTGLQYSSFFQKLNTDILNNYNDTEFIRAQIRNQKYRISVWAYRFDLEKKFENGMKAELGANVSYAQAKSLSLLQDFDLPEVQNIDYDYKEKIYASYSQLSGNFGEKVNYSTGVRIENNDVKGELKSGDSPLVNRKSTALFPKGMVNMVLDSTKNLTFNYGKSISRPSFSGTSSISVFINPFLEGSNDVNLQPTITDEVSTSFQWKNNSLTINYYWRKNPVYYSIKYENGQDRAIFSPSNLEKESGCDISVSIPINHKIWTASNYIMLSTNKIEDSKANIGESKPFLYVYTNHQFKIGKDTTVSLGGWGMGKRYEGIFQRNALIVLEGAFTTTFFDKLQCSLRLNDITRAMNLEESYSINGVNAEGTYFVDVHEIALSVKYNIGKSKIPAYKNKDVDENLDRIK